MTLDASQTEVTQIPRLATHCQATPCTAGQCCWPHARDHKQDSTSPATEPALQKVSIQVLVLQDQLAAFHFPALLDSILKKRSWHVSRHCAETPLAEAMPTGT